MPPVIRGNVCKELKGVSGDGLGELSNCSEDLPLSEKEGRARRREGRRKDWGLQYASKEIKVKPPGSTQAKGPPG